MFRFGGGGSRQTARRASALITKFFYRKTVTATLAEPTAAGPHPRTSDKPRAHVFDYIKRFFNPTGENRIRAISAKSR